MTSNCSPSSTAHEHVTDQPVCLSALSCSPVEAEAFRAALPRGSHLRNFAVGCLSAYAQSGGLVGLDPAVFSAANDLSGNLSRAIIPALLRDLGESGVVVKGITPFDAYVGVFPSSSFIRAALHDSSFLGHVSPAEMKYLGQLSSTLSDTSRHEVEARWLNQISSAFLCVAYGSGLSVSNLSKFLPDFDGKEKRISTVLAALHDSEVITLSTAGVQPEIFVSEALFERLEDRDLAETLRRPTREPIPFPFVMRERQRLEEAVTATDGSGDTQRPVGVARDMKTVGRPRVTAPRAECKVMPVSVASADAPKDGNRAGREVRDRILGVFEKAPSLSMGDLMASLTDLNLTDANVRYHVDLLCEKGALTRTGRGRGARISRIRGTEGVF